MKPVEAGLEHRCRPREFDCVLFQELAEFSPAIDVLRRIAVTLTQANKQIVDSPLRLEETRKIEENCACSAEIVCKGAVVLNQYEDGKRSESATSLSLLVRLRDDPDDQFGWKEFVNRYGGRIHGWCRKWGLQEADAHDVTQNVLLALSKQLQRFEYRPGGRFRAWLRTIVYRAWIAFVEQRKNVDQQAQNSEILRQLESQNAQDDLLQTLVEECDRELMEVAMENVRPRVKPHNWEAFQLMTFENLSAPEAAEKLDISPNAVYVACTRIRQMLMDEVDRLDQMEHERVSPT